MTPVEVARVAAAAGWRGNALVVAVAVALAESGGNPNAHALTSREDSRGLWQINIRAHPEYASAQLYDPKVNAQAAHTIWVKSGWGPWSTHNSGAYLLHMPTAEAAVALVRPGDAAVAAADPANVGGQVAAAAAGPVDVLAAALKEPARLLAWLATPAAQTRIVKVAIGSALVIGGAWLFARPVVQPVVDTGKKAAKVAAMVAK